MAERRGAGSHPAYVSSVRLPSGVEQRQGTGAHKPAGGQK
jgi:hypothetical protein